MAARKSNPPHARQIADTTSTPWNVGSLIASDNATQIVGNITLPENIADQALQCLGRNAYDYEWFKDNIPRRSSHTCKWFLDHPNYAAWRDARSGPLLVSADPGCGKSVLARHLIDSRFEGAVPETTAICYFFFKEGAQETVDRALCALLHQVICQRPDLKKEYLEKPYLNHGESLSTKITALWRILQQICDATVTEPLLIIVLDALDECKQDQENMTTLSRYIREHFEIGSGTMKILLTSRPYELPTHSIQQLETLIPRIRIRAEDDYSAISLEIDSVITSRVDSMSFHDDVKLHLKERLLQFTHRTYLWCSLVFDYLENDPLVKNSKPGINRAIDQYIPGTVYDAYERLLQRSKDPERTRKLCLIILAAAKPLTVAEMQIALEMKADLLNRKPSLEDLDLEPDASWLRRLCGPFITIHDGHVYLLHQTAREFLLNRNQSERIAPVSSPEKWAHSLGIRDAHMTLAEACMVYLILLQTNRGHSMRQELLHYAACYWAPHLSDADIEVHHDIHSVALMLIDSGWAGRPTWLDLRMCFHEDQEPRHDHFRLFDATSTSLMLACYFGLRGAVRLLLESSEPLVVATDARGRTAWWFAATGGSRSVVELLLEHENRTGIDLPDTHGLTPLLKSVMCRDARIVRLLVASGEVDVNGRRGSRVAPLHQALYIGATKVFKTLITTPSRATKLNVNLENYDGDTALHIAIKRLEWHVVDIILNTGEANVNARGKGGRTCLHYAIEFGYLLPIAGQMLGTGLVDFSTVDDSGDTYLHYAVYHYSNDASIIQSLLRSGKVDVGLRNVLGLTAIRMGREPVIRLLSNASNFDRGPSGASHRNGAERSVDDCIRVE